MGSFDAASGGSNDGSNPSWSHTSDSRATLGIVFVQDSDGDSTGASATWGGQSMTRKVNQDVAMFALALPPTGAQTVAIGGLGAGGAGVSLSFKGTEVVSANLFRDVDFTTGDSLTLSDSRPGDILVAGSGRRNASGVDPGNISWTNGEDEREEQSELVGSWQSRCSGATKRAPSDGGDMTTTVASDSDNRGIAAGIISSGPSGNRAFMMPFINAREKWNEIFGNGRVGQDGLWKPQPGILIA